MDERRPTEKQQLAISLIEKNLPGIKFEGSTKQEASRFIGEFMQRSIDVHNRRMLAAGKSAVQSSKPQQYEKGPKWEWDNEFYLVMVGRRYDSSYEKILVMPDISIAYIPNHRE